MKKDFKCTYVITTHYPLSNINNFSVFMWVKNVEFVQFWYFAGSKISRNSRLQFDSNSNQFFRTKYKLFLDYYLFCTWFFCQRVVGHKLIHFQHCYVTYLKWNIFLLLRDNANHASLTKLIYS